MVQRPAAAFRFRQLRDALPRRPGRYIFSSMAANRFARESDLALTRREFAALRRLDTPQKIQSFLHGLRQNFEHDGTIREKYNVVSRTANVQVSTGYKQNVIGFGWTNAVYLKNKQIVERGAAAAAR